MAAHSQVSHLIIFCRACRHGCFLEMREKAPTSRLGFSTKEQEKWRSISPLYVIYSFMGLRGKSPLLISDINGERHFAPHKRSPKMGVDYVLLVVVLPSVFMVCALSVNCMTVKPQCPNCTAQYIKTINASTGSCVECWPCPECNEGRGSSVPCGATVIVDTPLQCVLCVPGTNFSDITGTSQCQPCGMCSGQHESVLSECTRENNVMCECDVGFFRNKTTQECLPCASCCSGDHNILEHCQRDGDAIKKKCKFEEPWPSTCSSSVTAVGTTMYPSVLATSSSLMSYSYKHSTATPALGVITKITPAPSETVHIKVTSASFSRPDRHTKISGISTVNKGNVRGESPNVNIVIPMSKTAMAMLVSVLVTAGCVACAVCMFYKYRSWRAHNNPRALQMIYSELEARDKEERKSSECSGVDQHLLQLTEHPPQAITSPSSRTDEGIRLLPDIPPSLENGPQNLAQRTRKRLASEGDDNSAESDLEGHQPQRHIEDGQDGLPTTHSSLDKMSVCSDHHAALPSSPQDKPCSSSNIAASSGLTIKSTEQTSQPLPVIEKDMSSEMANQRAVCRLSAEPPIQSTEDNRGYNTHIKDVPESVIHDMCMLLDEEREIDGKDYKLLASELELTPVKIRYLKELKQMQGKSPSYVLLMHVFSAGENLGTLHRLRTILKRMGRFDVIKVLDDWVLNNN